MTTEKDFDTDAAYKRIHEGLVEVGDILVIDNGWTGATKFKITRVTKTLCKSLRKLDGYEHTYKREISNDMAKPYTQYNRNTYKVYREVV